MLVEPLDRGPERLALNEVHGIIRAAVCISAQAVNRNDPGVLEPARDLGFAQEPGLRGRVVGEAGRQLLQGDRAVQFPVEREKHFAQAAPRMRPDDLEAAARDSASADAQRADGRVAPRRQWAGRRT